MYSLGASYDADWKRRFISDVKPYVSYSVFMRDTDGFKDSQRLLAATLEQGDLFDVQELSHKLTAASEMLGLVASGEGLDELLLRELDEVGECLHATHGAPAHGDHIVARGAALAS